MIAAKDISKSKNGRTVLRSVALEARAGTVSTVIGPSGAGKTTLLRALSMIDPPETGTIDLDGRLLQFPIGGGETSFNPWPSLGVVFQDLWLWPHVTVERNILLPTRRRPTSAEIDRFKSVASLLDVERLLRRLPHELSGGERQRVAIARALMQQPSTLLLDEPVSASDAEHAFSLVAILRNLAAQGAAVLLVTHHLGFARRVSDVVMFMDGGIIVEAGGVDVLTNPRDERVQRFVSVL